MTDEELATFGAAIDAETDPELVGYRVAGASNAIANWYNQQQSPDYWIYRNLINIEEVQAAIELDDVVNMTTADVEKLNSIMNLRANAGFNGSKQSTRDAFDDVFSAAAGDDSQQAIAALWTRVANRIEVVFATGAGTAINPSTTTFIGEVFPNDVAASGYTPGV
jgi:hypothetical protein